MTIKKLLNIILFDYSIYSENISYSEIFSI